MKNKRKNGTSDWCVIKWILNICKTQIHNIAFLVVLNVVSGVTSVVFANFSKRLIDGATEEKSMQSIIKFAMALLGVVLIQMILSLMRNNLALRCKCRMDISMKKHLLNSIMKNDYSSVISYHTGELQNRLFNDVSVVSDAFTKIVPNTVFFVTRLSSALIYLIVLDKIFAFVFFGAGLVIFTVTRLFRKILKTLHKRVQETEGVSRSFIQEVIINLLAVKAFSAEEKILDRAVELQEDNFKAVIKRRNFTAFANTGLSAVFGLGSVFAIAFGAWRILTGVMTYGDVTAMVQLVNQVQSPFASLSGVMPTYYSMIASAERLMEIDCIAEEADAGDVEFDKEKVYRNLRAINFKNISFRYDRDIILDNASCSVKKGDFVAIMGISGIGKSTLLKLLLGVFNVSGGSIELKTSDGNIPIDRNTRPLFTYVPQGNLLISGTIKENLTFVNDPVSDEDIENAIRISCAKQFIDELPDGLDTVIGEKGLGLSEGQVQRLAIARSLLSKAPVLLLDEATSALDEDTEKQFLTNLKELDNVTCIIVSHKKAALEICNKHIQIINGKIVEE